MAKDNKKLVQAITSQEENFAQWYTDICVKAELVEYSSVKGFIILRPYGQAIWELIQKDMDARFKATGHENVAMPVLIPESLLQKEGELVNGFAPEVAWVTMGGSDKLEERLAVRPTSETMFCDHWSRVLHSYRELPMKYNQWCSVVRWEKTTRPFLRSREFWWQEGHTSHETAAEAEAFTRKFNVPLTQAYGIIEVGLPCLNDDIAGERVDSVGRLQQAYRLLKSGRWLLSEVAGQCGFSSLSVFSRCFRNVTGVPPSEYLRSERGRTSAE